jgi:hypothetical protein
MVFSPFLCNFVFFYGLPDLELKGMVRRLAAAIPIVRDFIHPEHERRVVWDEAGIHQVHVRMPTILSEAGCG